MQLRIHKEFIFDLSYWINVWLRLVPWENSKTLRVYEDKSCTEAHFFHSITIGDIYNVQEYYGPLNDKKSNTFFLLNDSYVFKYPSPQSRRKWISAIINCKSNASWNSIDVALGSTHPIDLSKLLEYKRTGGIKYKFFKQTLACQWNDISKFYGYVRINKESMWCIPISYVIENGYKGRLQCTYQYSLCINANSRITTSNVLEMFHNIIEHHILIQNIKQVANVSNWCSRVMHQQHQCVLFVA